MFQQFLPQRRSLYSEHTVCSAPPKWNPAQHLEKCRSQALIRPTAATGWNGSVALGKIRGMVSVFRCWFLLCAWTMTSQRLFFGCPISFQPDSMNGQPTTNYTKKQNAPKPCGSGALLKLYWFTYAPIAFCVATSIFRAFSSVSLSAYNRSTGSVPLARIIIHWSLSIWNLKPSMVSTLFTL